MVPFPLFVERLAAESLVAIQRQLGITASYIGFRMGYYIFAVVANGGPAIVPHHGLKVRYATYRACVVKQNGPPLSCLCLHQSTLVNPFSRKYAPVMFLITSHRTG